MSDHILNDEVELLDETGHLLHTLSELIQGTSNPIVKICLEEAYEDIAHLTSTGSDLQDVESAEAA